MPSTNETIRPATDKVALPHPRGWFTRATIALSLLASWIGCSSSPSTTSEPRRPNMAVAARGASYPMDHLGAAAIQLANGEYQDAGGELEVRLVQSAVGDIDGDSLDDAAVVLASQTGGSGTFVDLYALLDRDAGPVARGPASLGDRVKVDSLRVTDRQVFVHLVVHGPEDPLCCPTQPAVERFVLRGDTLTRHPVELP